MPNLLWAHFWPHFASPLLLPSLPTRLGLTIVQKLLGRTFDYAFRAHCGVFPFNLVLAHTRLIRERREECGFAAAPLSYEYNSPVTYRGRTSAGQGALSAYALFHNQVKALNDRQ